MPTTMYCKSLIRMTALAFPIVLSCTSFTAASSNGAQSCVDATSTIIRNDIEGSIGIPVSHRDNVDRSKLTEICYDRYCTLYNSEAKTPEWVVERLTPAIVSGMNTRPKIGFSVDKKLKDIRKAAKKADKLVPIVAGKEPVKTADMVTATNADYTNSNLARGHQAPSADYKCSEDWMKQTFKFSNAVPQVQDGFNGGIWRELEDHVNNLAMERDEIFVITGPVAMDAKGKDTIIEKRMNACGRRIVLAGLSTLNKSSICDANNKDSSKTCKYGVGVPSGLFKIIYIPETNRAFGFLMSNEDHRKLKKRDVDNTAYLEEWRTSIQAIEEAANLKFFTNLSLRSSRVQKQHCTETRWR